MQRLRTTIRKNYPDDFMSDRDLEDEEAISNANLKTKT